MNKIAVFCSGSDHIAPVYREKAEELGVWLGRHHKWLVYGGSDSGLMEVVGKAVKENGGMLMGIIPTKLEEAGRELTVQVIPVWDTEGWEEAEDAELEINGILPVGDYVANPEGIQAVQTVVKGSPSTEDPDPEKPDPDDPDPEDPGDPVLVPISFTVTVDDFQNGGEFDVVMIETGKEGE